MSTPNTVKAQLQNLIDFSNRKTGKSDTDLTGVVNSLIKTCDEKTSILNGSITEYCDDKIIRLRPYAFAYCQELTRISLPNTTTFRNAVFYNDIALIDVYVPSIETTQQQFVTGCASLEYLDLYKASAFNGNFTFAQCVKLKTILLRKTQSICTLGNVASFQGTPIESGTGYVYVPRDLIESYKTATNWVTFASQFRALEDYTVDGTIDGELDWDKVNGGTA
jgi:hypothetical protein